MFTKPTPLIERFLSRFTPGEADECWLWKGAPTSAGYGVVCEPGRGGKAITAHRVSYQFYRGPVPDHLFVCHKCDVPLCVNPAHLFLGTPAENMADMMAKGRGRGGSKPGEEAHRARLTSAQVIAILSDPRSHEAIAADYGVVSGTIYNIKTGRTWKHLSNPVAP